MKRYNLYIMKQLAQAAVLITLSLTGIVWLTQALRFIDFIVSRGISFGSFLELTLLLVPSLILFILPFALLCGSLYTYYRLMMDSELLVMSSAGLSRLQLAKPAFLVGLMATLFAYCISLYLLPVSYREFKDTQAFLRDNYASLLLQEDVFNTPVDGLTVYIHDRDRDGILRGIIVHDSRDETKPPITMMAEEAKLIQSAQGPRFILYRGNRQQVDKGKLSFLNFDQYTLDVSFYTSNTRKRLPQPEEMFLPQLLYPEGNDDEAHRLIAEGHNRLSWPLFALAMTVLPASVLLTGEFSRRGQWRRVIRAIIAAALSLSASIGLLNLAVHQPWMIALMYINVLLITGASLWLLMREPRAVRHVLAQGV
jgi:lipopolysaccharide export system permease protein